jgi:DnaJ-class molecular chaperone
MTHSEKCPVCNGCGKNWNLDDGITEVTFPRTCHGCSGKGWITIPDFPVKPFPILPIHHSKWEMSK